MIEEEVESEQDKDYHEGFKDFCAIISRLHLFESCSKDLYLCNRYNLPH